MGTECRTRGTGDSRACHFCATRHRGATGLCFFRVVCLRVLIIQVGEVTSDVVGSVRRLGSRNGV